MFLEGTPVALESIANGYGSVDEIETAGCKPLTARTATARLIMGNINTTEKLDARGLATLLPDCTLPTVWIVPAEFREEREMPRSHMASCKMRVSLKDRSHATLAKDNLSVDGEEGSSAIFATGFSLRLE